MNESKHTPGPWVLFSDAETMTLTAMPAGRAGEIATVQFPTLDEADPRCVEQSANANLIIAAPDLLEAAQMLETAELARANCDDCEGDGEPEACGTCFPAFDDARIKRRLAIAKATATTDD